MLAITIRKMMRKRCATYLAYIIYSKKDNVELTNFSIIREFSDVFLNELPGLPSKRKV
jgi:hypothetical protein